MEICENDNEITSNIIKSEYNIALFYERSRIKALAEQRDDVQKKTFTKWINSHLERCIDIDEVQDLNTDLRDGIVLLRLLEVISGETLGRPSKGKLRIHCLENVSKALQFMEEQHVYLANIGANDIVNGNQTLTLGLIWTLILRFQIQGAIPSEFDGKRTSKEALLLWCQMKTANYSNINITNFTTSWKDGMAFNAILHKHDPDVVDFLSMTKATPVENMNTAFQVAEKVFGVPALLDAKDVAVDHPDERSIMTYIGVLSNALNKLKINTVKCKRLENIIKEALSAEVIIKEYESGCRNLLSWINEKIEWMNGKELVESLPGVKKQLNEFKNYRLNDKPQRFAQRSDLEIEFFEIQTQIRKDNRRLCLPPEGKVISDVNKAWDNLEKAEHMLELRLYGELMRQEKLDQLGAMFHVKANIRSSWVHDNHLLANENVFGDSFVTVEAAIKKHEALEGDIFAHQDRIDSLGRIAYQLETERFYNVGEIKERYIEIAKLWENLLDALKNRRQRLQRCMEVQQLFQESEYLLDWIREIDGRLQADDFGKHLLGVQNVIQKHRILSRDIQGMNSRVSEVCSKLSACDLDSSAINSTRVKESTDLIQRSYRDLLQNCTKREKELEKYKVVYELVEELDNCKEWIKDANQLMVSPDTGHDLQSVERLMRTHDQICNDVNLKKKEIENNLQEASKNEDVDDCIGRKNLIREKKKEVIELLENLDNLSHDRKDKLGESLKFYHLLADVDDSDDKIIEQKRLFENTEVGDKLSTTELYLKQLGEHAIQVDVLQNTIKDLLSRKEDIDKNHLDRQQESELMECSDRMHNDFEELLKVAKHRRDLLENSMTKFRLMDDIDTVDCWIGAKESFLQTLVPTEKVEELDVLKHRFDSFIDQMKKNSDKLRHINDTSADLIDSEHPEAEIISSKQNEINRNWNELADLTAEKQNELHRSLAFNQFVIECQETSSWISDKIDLLKRTDDLKDDLDGIMNLQRRLGTLHRDVKVIEAKVLHLNKQATGLASSKPEEKEVIDSKITAVNERLAELKLMLRDRNGRLNSSNELQKFLQDLDAFNIWLPTKQNEVATENVPMNLQESERLFNQHQQVKDEIDCWKPEVVRLLQFGRRLSKSNENPQYLMFNQRLDSLEEGWKLLQKMCIDKEANLRQSIDIQTFFRDALQVDGILTKQETFLSKDQLPTTVEGAQSAIRDFEVFTTSVAANLPRVDAVLTLGAGLIHSNPLSDKVSRKCANIRERCEALQGKISTREQTLNDDLKLKIFTENVSDLEEWISEKAAIVSETSYKDKKDASKSYQHFKILVKELEANEEKVNEVIKIGDDLACECPHLQSEIEPQIEYINNMWSELILAAQDKCDLVEEDNREIIFDANAKSMMSWMDDLSSKMRSPEEPIDDISLVEINGHLKDHENKDIELKYQKEMLNDIANHAVKLKEQYPDRVDEFEQIHMEIAERLTEVEVPMMERRDKLSQRKIVQQFLGDIRDEKEWIEDKLNTIKVNEILPVTLLVCIQKIRRHKTLTTEINNHETRIDNLMKIGLNMINEDHPSSEIFETEIQDLDGMWKELLEVTANSQQLLDNSHLVLEYIEDANESECWMGDREFELWREETIKDEYCARSSMRKHEVLINTIEEYVHVINELGERSKNIVNERIHEWNTVLKKQKKLDLMYASLIDLGLYRRVRIEDLIKLYQVFKIITDLEEWIATCTLIAASNDVASSFSEATSLVEGVKTISRDIDEIGGPRVTEAIEMCNKLIGEDNQDAAEIAYWKDRVIEAWHDLHDLFSTRIEFLEAVWKYFKFMEESFELMGQIKNTIFLIPKCVDKDPINVARYNRKHTEFNLKVQDLKMSIDNCLDSATNMVTLYSGEKEILLRERIDELQKLQLTFITELDKGDSTNMADFLRFSAMIEELLTWMTETEDKLSYCEKPRDIFSVELMLEDHGNLKDDINSRDEGTSACIALGKTLLDSNSSTGYEVRKKCAEVISKDFKIKDKWTERQEYLDIMADVFQFDKRASVAEEWLKNQEPYVQTIETGDSLFDTLDLIRKHQRLERTLSTQEETFNELKTPTALETKQHHSTVDMELEKINKNIAKLEELLKEFCTPFPSPKETSRRTSEVVEVVEEVLCAETEEALQSSEIDFDISRSEEPTISESTPGIEVKPPEPMTGTVNRKQEWESSVKRASNRSWHSLFMSFRSNQLTFYKDEKHYKENKKNTYKHELPFNLKNALCTVATAYKKRGNVFRIHFSTGSEYLIQSTSDREMKKWVETLNKAGGSDPEKHMSSLPSKKSTYGVNFDEHTASLSFRKPK